VKTRSPPLILTFSTWSVCMSVELDLLAWFLGVGFSVPSSRQLWPAYEFRFQIPTLMFALEVITDSSIERAVRAKQALDREFPEERSPTSQDEE
jgi:hypothetical protein